MESIANYGFVMIDLGRLRSEMQRQGLSQALLASSVGASPAAIQQILNGKTRHTRLASKIARTLGVSLDWLEGEDVEPERKIRVTSKEEDLHPSVFLYFGDNDDQNASEVIDQRILVMSSYWANDIFGTANENNEVIIYRVGTREMAPTILPGDDVAIRGDDSYDGSPDSIWFFQHNERTFVRRLAPAKSGMLTCSADNPAFPPFEVPADQIVVRGRVVWQGRSLLA